jgi:TrmH family RNA methyltransferase
MTITSSHNEALKEIRKLHGRRWRDKLASFVAEGEDLIAAAEAAGWPPSAVYVAADSGLNGIDVAPHVLAEISQLGSGTRAIGVYPQRWAQPTERSVALWGVNDPGNVGTVIRSALAFGARCVVLGPGTADPFGHKAGIEIDRKVLADIAVREPESFKALVEQAKAAVGAAA